MNDPAPVVVLGEALVDVFPDRQVLGGAPFNVARNLAAIGGAPVLVSRVGQDAAGDRIARQMVRLGMTTDGLQRDATRATGRVRVTLSDGQPAFHIEADGAWDRIERDDALQAVASRPPALAYFGSLAQRSEASREAIHAALRACAAPALLDLNLRPMPGQREIADASLRVAAWLKVNEDELRALFDWFAPAIGPAEGGAVFELMRHFDLGHLVLTRGARGWAFYQAASGRVLEGPAPKVQVRDTVGAGDAFAAVLLLGQARGWELETMLSRAAWFSAQVCTLHGAFDEASGLYREARERWEA